MSTEIPKSHLDLLQRPVVASLATVLPSGQPQVQPVWCGWDGRHVLVNTEKGRVKYRNLHERRQATLLLVNPDDVFHWIEIRGEVESETEQGAEAQLDQLAKRYLGVDKYPFGAPGDVRVLFRIRPTHVVTFGPNPG
jgi:PPOX class probable F420-dependent enzyme